MIPRAVIFGGPVEPVGIESELDGRATAADGGPPKNPPNKESVPADDFDGVAD